MRQPLLLVLLAVGTFFYFHQPPSTSKATTGVHPPSPAAPSEAHAAEKPAPIVATVASYHERWKSGPNAQTDLKTGPNAQTDFAPFAPSEHATWNQTSGYTIVAGPQMPRR